MRTEGPDPLRVIVGPTAAGKSAIAMALAEQIGATIISADSRQLYTGFDLGTAKPTVAEQTTIPHAGIDIIPPTERYSAHRWAADAEQWMAAARDAGRPSLIVGGTGFYIRALVEPLDAVPSLDPERRRALEGYLATLDRELIHRWCARLDPARAALGHAQQRRAIETVLLSGTRLSHAFASVDAPTPARRPVHYLVVDPGPVLASRIALRVQAMVQAGWPEEVRALMATVPADAPAWQASGYGMMRTAVSGGCPMAHAIERITIETRQYAKRQRTWFRHQLPAAQVTLLDSSMPDAAAQAMVWWSSTGEGRI